MPIAAVGYNCPGLRELPLVLPDIGTPDARCDTDDVLLTQA